MIRNRSLSAFAAVLAACALSTSLQAQAADNLVANGSLNFGAGGPPTQWSFLNPLGEFWVSFDNQASPDGGSYLGIQYLASFAPRFNAGGIEQTIGGLETGATYTLSFYSMTNHDAFDPSARQDWQVTFGDATQTGKQTFFTGTGAWVQSTMTFTATAASEALSFVAQYLPGSYPEMLNLDGIVLTKTADAPTMPSAVPEPTTYALLLAGLAAVGWGVRRRQTAA